MADKNYITPEGFQKLKDEYHYLLHKDRPKVVEVVSWAASNGDRSENADYQYGKKRLREIDRRLKFLTDRLDAAEIVDPKSITGKIVRFGATVTISDDDGEETVYQIVGADELDPTLGRISWKSPIARALIGKNEGDEVTVQLPKGVDTYVIEKVIYR